MRSSTIVALLTVVTAAPVLGQRLEAPFRLMAFGDPIRLDLGHAQPLFVDFIGDGKRDLLVGQFGDGRLRIYPNLGTDAKPKFGVFDWFIAGGEIAQIGED